jgi:Protein of unknown function (DUF3631)/Bifunctional DNA primase/polymerase, N-terminal
MGNVERRRVKTATDIEVVKALFPRTNAEPEVAELDAALAYARDGIPVLPLWPRDGDKCVCKDRENCKRPGKHPVGRLVPNGFKDATTDEAKIRKWWSGLPDAGIGAPTGAASGLLIIDIDVKPDGPGGYSALDELRQTLGELPETRMAMTPSGGVHLYFKHVEGVRSSQGALGKMLDVRADGGFIVLPPSHGLYRWTDNRPPAELPAAWASHLKTVRGTSTYYPPEVVAKLDELARLDRVAYDQARKAAAKQLNIRKATLDDLVEERRARAADTAATADTCAKQLKPWPERVDGSELLEALAIAFEDHVVMSRAAATAAALWIVHTYAHAAAVHSPLLGVTGPTKRVGKTTVLRLIKQLVPTPLPAANVTAATVFRAIEAWHPTLIIDEADAFLHDKGELRSVLDSGHERQFAFVLRCVGDEHEPTLFSTWCPKAVAFIGRLHPTLEDRMIKLELRRKTAAEKVKRLSTDDPFETLRRQCLRWTKDNLAALKDARPQMPKELNDRACDNWRPLFAIAEVAGGGWLTEARAAARALSAVDDDETYAIVLLGDLRKLFEDEAADGGKNLSSMRIVEKLAAMDDRPWPEFKNGKPITPHGVARLLKGFKIKPRSVRHDDDEISSGYKPEQFADAWKRYLPEEGA